MSTPTSSPTPSSSLAPTETARPLPPTTIPPLNDELARDVHATLAGRREMGPEYDQHFADALVERLHTEIQREVERQMRAATRGRNAMASQRHFTSAQRLGLAITSLALLIPLVVVAGIFSGGLTGVAIACAAVVAVNLFARFF